jgi:hypothetical protein
MEIEKIIFEDGQDIPTYIMKNGEKKKPRLRNKYGDTYTIWLTDLEYESLLKKLNKPKKNWWKNWFKADEDNF